MTQGEIEAFLAVCEQGNFTRASEALFISQSTLSTKLKMLEKEVGCELIVRNKGLREIRLTPEGERFYELACQYQSIVQQMQSIGERKEKTTLRVASINSLGTHLFPAVYELFMEQCPQVELEIQDKTTRDAFLTIEKGMTDLAFGPGNRTSAAVSMLPAFSEDMVLLCNQSMNLPSLVQREMLDTESEIFIGWSSSYTAWHAITFGERKKPPLRLELMNQLEFFMKKASCWAIVPYSVACELEKNPQVRRCRTGFDIPRRYINCLYSTAEKDSAAKAAFLDCLKDRISAMDPEKITCLF